jgi:aryl-alcohol dehydrogenase-like predicted oxidoreductase
MKTVQLGKHGPHVSAIGLGTMGLGGQYVADHSSDLRNKNLLREAIDLGVTIFDTAEVYADGHAERILGQAIASCRDEITVATKFSPKNSFYNDLIKAAEGSLKRLATETIDLYQNHWPNPQVPLEDTLSALVKLVEQGKVRSVGLSNMTVAEIDKCKLLLPSDFPLVSVQQEYNLEERFVEHKILPNCYASELALIAYSPLGQGKLANTQTGNKMFKDLSYKYNLSKTQICLQWVCRKPRVIAIPMTSMSTNLLSNVKSLDVEIDDTDLKSLSEAYAINIIEIPIQEIKVIGSHTGKAYTSIEDAKNNTLGISPSPMELAAELTSFDILKPVKVRRKVSKNDKYELFEGQLRYWAWAIAHDQQRPIMAQVVV